VETFRFVPLVGSEVCKKFYKGLHQDNWGYQDCLQHLAPCVELIKDQSVKQVVKNSVMSLVTSKSKGTTAAPAGSLTLHAPDKHYTPALLAWVKDQLDTLLTALPKAPRPSPGAPNPSPGAPTAGGNGQPGPPAGNTQPNMGQVPPPPPHLGGQLPPPPPSPSPHTGGPAGQPGEQLPQHTSRHDPASTLCR